MNKILMHLMLEFSLLRSILKFELGLEFEFVNAKENTKKRKKEKKPPPRTRPNALGGPTQSAATAPSMRVSVLTCGAPRATSSLLIGWLTDLWDRLVRAFFPKSLTTAVISSRIPRVWQNLPSYWAHMHLPLSQRPQTTMHVH